MKRHVIAIALGGLFALPAFADYETGLTAGEIQPGVSRSAPATGKTREDVRHELIEEQRAGNVVANAEQGWTRDQAKPVYRTSSIADSILTREEVLARSAEPMGDTDEKLSENHL